jgi:cation diffusion facilitator CzcD-associated flavoprotein CzcO
MSSTATIHSSTLHDSVPNFDVIVIGAGFSGMHALYTLRSRGLKVRVYDEGQQVGGTWNWNRYPGARVDFPVAPYYCYTFSDELMQEFDWPERQPDQATVLKYLNFVADRMDLRRDIELGTRITGANYDELSQRWRLTTSRGTQVTAQFVICASGALSAANSPDIPGIKTFAGECYHTGRWPQNQEVDFTGKRVAVLGTGSSGVQSIPVIARQCQHLTVLQRTPQYTVPAGNRPVDPAFIANARETWPEIKRRMRVTPFGSPFIASTVRAMEHTPEQRREVYERFWAEGGFNIVIDTYCDLFTDKASNDTLSEFVRDKIRAIVKNPDTARKLLPNYLVGTKRQILDDGYYATFNRDNVTLVDLREDPIVEFYPGGVRTKSGDHPLDMLILATGFDAITGTLQRLNPRGRGGVSLNECWKARFNSYLGITIPGFPNLFMVHGPESPGVLFNMPLGAELENDWIRDCILHLRAQHQGAIEPAPGVDVAWGEEVASHAHQTLFEQTESWYTGANIAGKHRQFAVHVAGPQYFAKLTEIAAAGYPGFVFEPVHRTEQAEA